MINTDLYYKIIRNGGTYNTKKYRYRIDDRGRVLRCRLDYLDRLMPLHYERWQPHDKKYMDLF